LLAIVVIVRALWPKSSAPFVTSERSESKGQGIIKPWAPAQRADVRRILDAAFATSIADGATYSLAVLDAEGRTIYDNRAGVAVRPASVEKLVIAGAALDRLGANYRFHTLLAAERGVGNDGTLAGNLWLVGSGDPSFRSDDLRRGVDALARAGLRAIGGGIRVDPSSMHGPEINPHWDPSDLGEDFDAPTSGMSIDGDTAEFRVYGARPGTPARVVVVPQSSAVRVSGAIATSYGSNDVVIAPQGTPNDFALSGSIPQQTEEKFWLPVHGIPLYAGNVLLAMLREAAIQAAGPPAVQPAPLDSIALWEHRSAALTTLLSHMLYLSDNHYAEQLLRTLGGDAGDAPDDAGGIAAEEAFLRERGIPTEGFHAVDGSGLAEVDRVSAMTLARVLTDGRLYSLLPQGGRDGTLKHYDFTTALGRVRAKTGHLSDAASLAGYVNTAHHGRIVFAFMINNSPGDPDAAYVRAVDSLAEM
jgi:D-alanyl-D-alanine carboxypeptidase/D-alanyl-D-alanine-endopeptidase (penicillin-binding protein 4)